MTYIILPRQATSRLRWLNVLNRTLRGRMTRFLTAINSKSYYNVLQDLIDGYNASYHKSIKMRPLDVHKENERIV